MPRFTKQQILSAAKRIRVNLEVVPLETLRNGLKVELEHGSVHPETNITDDAIIPTMKIVMAHLYEGLDYYDELEKMEKTLERRHKGKRRPALFISSS